MTSIISSFFAVTLSLLFVGCSSAQKIRLEQREKLSQSTGMYCEFISGDVHNDIDVELNLQIAKRCDGAKPYTMTNYKNSSENYGVIYCCNLKRDDKKIDTRGTPPPPPQAAKREATDNLDLDDDGADLKKDVTPTSPPQPPVRKLAPTTAPPTAAPAPPAQAKPATPPSASTAAAPSAASAPKSSSGVRPLSPNSATANAAKPAAPAQSSPQSVQPRNPEVPKSNADDILGD